jgi:L,D-peptidoglycan transpeptidase YkuD (ErfK/YbiS/YcfS/YnhG family)
VDIVVSPSEPPWSGTLAWPNGSARCALGRGGVAADKRESDGATPAGAMALRRVFYRPDREAPPATRLPTRALAPEDGWCDDPASADYNRHIRRPFAARHEALWREDALYDLIVVLGWNDDPPASKRGSAIFLHVASDGYAPTEGCVALARQDLLRLLVDCGPGDRLIVNLSPR